MLFIRRQHLAAPARGKSSARVSKPRPGQLDSGRISHFALHIRRRHMRRNRRGRIRWWRGASPRELAHCTRLVCGVLVESAHDFAVRIGAEILHFGNVWRSLLTPWSVTWVSLRNKYWS